MSKYCVAGNSPEREELTTVSYGEGTHCKTFNWWFEIPPSINFLPCRSKPIVVSQISALHRIELRGPPYTFSKITVMPQCTCECSAEPVRMLIQWGGCDGEWEQACQKYWLESLGGLATVARLDIHSLLLKNGWLYSADVVCPTNLSCFAILMLEVSSHTLQHMPCTYWH